MEKGELREFFLSACNKIAEPLLAEGFNATQKGQCWKKKSDNKDITFEVYFQSDRKNDAGYIGIVPHFHIFSNKVKEHIREVTGKETGCGYFGTIYGGNLGILTPNAHWMTWNIAKNRDESIAEISGYLIQYALPVFKLFDNPIDAVAVIGERGTVFFDHMKKRSDGDSLSALTFMLLYGNKETAETYFNGHMARQYFSEGKDVAARKVRELWAALQQADAIDFERNAFWGAELIKQAYVEGLQLRD